MISLKDLLEEECLSEDDMRLSSIIETIDNKSTEVNKDKLNYIDTFVKYAKKFLNIKGYVPVIVVDKNEIPITTAYYSPENKNVKVAIKGRALPDFLRSLAHELTHPKQDELGELGANSGMTGSKQENQANSLAGIIMRNFSQMHPEIYSIEGEIK